MDQWKKEGLVTKEKKGRETEIKITDIGKELIEVLRQYDEIATKQLNKIKRFGEDQTPAQDQGPEKKEEEGEKGICNIEGCGKEVDHPGDSCKEHQGSEPEEKEAP